MDKGWGAHMEGKKKKRFTIGKKMYLFVTAIVLFAIIGACVISFAINADQIDRYFKSLAINTAKNYALFADPKYLKELKAVAQSEEFQKLRDEAEENEDESIVIEYLKEKGLWDSYVEKREHMRKYVSSMQDIKYLYMIVWSGPNDTHDMYLLDADDVPVYETGYWELREEELAGVDATKQMEATINHGDWGWLCSGYAPVYDTDGSIICHVGCDIDMEDVMMARRLNLTAMLVISLIYMGAVLAVAMYIVGRSVVGPLNTITGEMGKFAPASGKSYEEAGVINLDLKSEDEIGDIYHEIRNMQLRIVDHINDITAIRQDKEKFENDIKNKEKMIGQISEVAYKDNLTGIGNNTAYLRKSGELKEKLESGDRAFAIVMVDANGLKGINDNYGHSYGDIYIKGCSHIICEVFKHSPVFRIGGDEFVAIAMGEDFDIREERVAELRDCFDKTFNDKEKDPWYRFSASVGIADCEAQDSSVEQVFMRADKRMYEEKLRFKKAHKIKTTGR